jgi:hypothetical protein
VRGAGLRVTGCALRVASRISVQVGYEPMQHAGDTVAFFVKVREASLVNVALVKGNIKVRLQF